MNIYKAALHRALRTLVQVAASAAITAIGTASTIGEVDWKYVASTSALAAVLSILMSLATGLPEVSGDDDVSAGHPA